jgi:hypothetical protein
VNKLSVEGDEIHSQKTKQTKSKEPRLNTKQIKKQKK